MKFKTYVDIPLSNVKMNHSTNIILFGSCFSSNIGLKLKQHKFIVDVNPFGILYNPFSISAAINRLIQKSSFIENDIVYNQGLYHSFMHHGEFSSISIEKCLDNINRRFDDAVGYLAKADILLVTFGSAFVYRDVYSKEIVGNCHKFPDEKFYRQRLSVDDIMKEWSTLIDDLSELRPDLKILFTVSPVRHWKDGAHENQLSKATLLLAIDSLRQKYDSRILYFPAYEVVMDELRDYRFYDEDMLHPSSVAVEYIWNIFSDTYFSKETAQVNRDWYKIRKSLEHRPLHPYNDSYRVFLENTIDRLEVFSNKYPNISCEKEKEILLFKIRELT